MNIWFTRVILSLLVAEYAISKCSEGTLKCNTTGQTPVPEICDFILHYQLNRDDMTCQIKKVDGCKLSAFDEDTLPCLMCETGMVLDKEKTKCVAVADESKRENCTGYDGVTSACLSCAADFYLSNGECLAVGDVKIENCAVYESDTDCKICSSGFYLKDNKCVKFVPIPNCYSHTPRQCQKCSSDYVINPAFSTQTILTKSFLINLSNLSFNASLYQTNENMGTDCQLVKTKNCAEPVDYLTCSKCDPGHYLDENKQCQRFPDPPIDNCKTYTDSNTCFRCDSNYFMEEANKCKIVTFIDNCQDYIWNEDKCESCIEGFLLLDSGICHERKLKTINNCKKLDTTKDQCATCKDGFTLTKDFKGCFADIPNCKTQEDAVTPENLKHTCTECNDNYYIDGGFCKEKTIAFCKDYKPNSNNCETCDDGYYLLSNACLKIEIDFCKEYETNTNRCKKCDDGYYQDVSKCILQNVSNCEKYVDNSGACDECQENFYLSTDGKCLKNTVTGCETFRKNTDICDQCKDNHWHDTDNNLCYSQNVANCSKYKPQSSSCEKCDSLYYLDDQENKCKPSNISNCKTYQVNSNDCLVCDDFFYLEDKQCKPVSIPQCKSYTNNKNKCESCGKGYFQLSGTCHKQNISHCILYVDNSNQCQQCAKGYYIKNSVCEAQSLSNCSAYSDNVNECSTCDEGYYLDTDHCDEQKIPHCKVHKSQENKCEECVSGYYTNTDKTGCVEKNITGCLTHSNALDESKCEKCENLKFLNTLKTSCSSITNISNCFKSDGKTNACQECNPNFFFQSGVCSGTRTASHLDSNCTSNTETVLNTKCASCGNSKAVLTAGSPAIAKNFLSTNNCLQIDSTTGACSQCKDLYEFDNSNACVAAANPSNLKCKRMKNNHGTTKLAENLKCEECRDQSVYFLENEVCKDRVVSNLITGCGMFVKNEDKCLACDTNKIGKEPKAIAACELVSGLSLSPATIQNCQIRENNDKCHACLQGYYLNAEKTECKSAETDAKISMAFTTGMHSFGSIQDASASVANCALYAQVDEVTLGCVKCNPNHVGIVPEPKSDNTDTYRIASHKDSLTGKKNYSNAFSECHPGNQPYRINPTTKHIADNECAIGYKIDGKNGFACLRTIGSKKGKSTKITHDANGVALGKTIWGIGDCRDIEKERSEFTNIDYKFFHKMERLLFSSYMPFTNCSSENLLYMMIIDLSDPFITLSKIKDNNGNYLEQVYCQPFSKFENGELQNCAIYAITADQDAGVDFGSSQIKNTHCIACKPGHKATITGPSITACTPIADCDTSVNTWLDACETPTNDSWTSKSVDSMEIIAYDVPVPNNKTINDCLVVDVADSTPRCIMCKAGYKVDNKNCSSTVIANSNCAKRSIGTTDILVPQILKRKRGTFNGFIYSRTHSNIGEFGTNTALGCNTCDPNYIPRVDTSTLIRTCQPHSSQSAIVQNCDNIDYNDFHTCHNCQGALLTSPLDHSCVDVSANPQCKELQVDPNNALQTNCKTCNASYYLDPADNMCKASNCEAYSADDPTECILCNTGMKPDAGSKVKCVANDLVNDPCDSYSQKLGTCGRCKDSSKFLYIIKTVNGATPLHLGFECVTFDLTGQGFGNYNIDYPYIEIVFDKSNDQMTTSVKGLMTKDQKDRTYSTSAVDSDPAANHCVTSRPMTNCKTDSNLGGLYCKKCEDTYNVNSSNICFPSPVEFCKVAYLADDGSNKCTSCLDSHYINSNGTQCLPRSASKFCKTFDLSKDECQDCPSDRYKTGSNGCELYSAQFCSEFEPGEDKCKSCQKGYYKDSGDNDKCKPYTVDKCNDFKADKDECLKCVANHIKDLGQNNKCVFYEANNCETFNISEDKCNTCIANHYKNASDLDKCTQFQARNCKDYQTSVDACDKCKDFHYKDSGGICVLYTAENCDDFKSDADECDNCATGYYKDADDSNKCKLNTAKNCKNPSTTKNECQDCLPFFFMDTNDNNICKEYTAENCNSLADGKNECDECITLYYKDSGDNNICKKNTASDCYTYSKTDNLCDECIKDFYKDAGTNNKCIPNTAEHCLLKNKDKNECISCKPGFLKKTSGGGVVTCETYKAANCNGFAPDKDECTACINGYWKDTSGDSVLCMLRKNSNCSDFEEEKDECISCKQGTYLVNGTCKHVTLVNNCKTYSITEDTCVTCFDEFFKDPNGNNCWPFPNGVKNCVSYSSSTKCATCSDEYFYDEDNNFCTKIETPIEGCKVHVKADECVECKTSRVLISNRCPEITAQNCSEYQNFDKCSKCIANHILDSETGVCSASGISNCIEAQKEATENLCITCDKGYFLSENRKTCDPPETPIDGCLDYETKEKCKECAQNKLLSFDGKKCSDIGLTSGAHCVDAIELETPYCEICSPGYKRDGAGKCTKLGLENCLVSSDDDKKCELCISGTFMDEKGVCTTFQAPVDNEHLARLSIGFLFFVYMLLDL